MDRISGQPLTRMVFVGSCIATFALFNLYFYLAGGVGVFSDGIGYYAPMRSLVFDGDLNVSNEYRYFAQTTSNLSGESRWPFPIPQYSKYTIGMGLVLFPFFLIGHLFAMLLQGLGIPVVANGLSWPYELAYCTGSQLLGVCGLYLCYRGAKARFGAFPAIASVVGIWFASPNLYYLAVVPSMSHAVSQFLVSAALHLALTKSWLEKRGLQFQLGVILGLAALVRPQNALFVLVLFALVLVQWRAAKQVRWADLLAWGPIVVVMLFMLLLQLLVYRIEFGNLTQTPYLIEGDMTQNQASFTWLQPHIMSVFFSGFHGLFAWHPILLLALVGICVYASQDRQFLALLLGFALQVYVVASWHNWWQGASFGGRMFCSSSYIFVMGLAALWRGVKTLRAERFVGLLVLGFVIWNVLLVMQYTSGMIPAEAPISMIRLVRNQFRVIPFFLDEFLRKHGHLHRPAVAMQVRP
jgi:hypothetical protein